MQRGQGLFRFTPFRNTLQGLYKDVVVAVSIADWMEVGVAAAHQRTEMGGLDIHPEVEQDCSDVRGVFRDFVRGNPAAIPSFSSAPHRGEKAGYFYPQ
jgi:hypothetical protein